MATIGDGGWDSSLIQDRHWRKVVEQLADARRPAEERLRLAKKLLRDGNDLACCALFHIYRAEAPRRGWGRENPLDAALGAMRFRALRILGSPSRLQDRDHREAAQLLPWIAKPRDRTILARILHHHARDDGFLAPTLEATVRVAPELPPDEPAEDLRDALAALSARPDLPAELHRLVARALAAWPAPHRLPLLRGAAHDAQLGPSTRWPYIEALLALDPDEARPLALALKGALGRGHLLHEELDRALRGTGTPTPPAPPSPTPLPSR